MKKKLLIILVIFIAGVNFYPMNLHASYYVNKFGIEIADEDYNRLLGLGFSDVEIHLMTKEEYELNKNLYGEIVSVSSDISLLGADTIESNYKILETKIIKLNNGNYRYKTDLKWKILPKVRSYDVIGIGIDSNSVKVVGNVVSKLTYNDVNIVNPSYTYQTTRGIYSVLKLPTSANVMFSSIYFDVQNISGTSLKAVGDYAHATSAVDLANVKKATISTSGILFPSDVAKHYDTMMETESIYEL